VDTWCLDLFAFVLICPDPYWTSSFMTVTEPRLDINHVSTLASPLLLLWVAVLQSEGARRHVWRHVLDVGRVNRFISSRHRYNHRQKWQHQHVHRRPEL
jgi:hypothetical protein